MAEVISEQQPRIKYDLRRTGSYALAPGTTGPELARLCRLMLRMEAAGAAPVLCDGKVGGNCAIDEGLATAGGGTEAVAAGPGGGAILVSRSGKAAGAALAAGDFVRVSSFDRGAWAAEFSSPSSEVRPSSDLPLLWACLAPGAQEAYGWGERPRVAFHGHALEAGPGLAAARAHGIPVSERETLFSTPEDLAELEALFRAHPYPQHSVYIRRGHGFFVLGGCVADCEAALDAILAAAAEAGGPEAPKEGARAADAAGAAAPGPPPAAAPGAG